LNKGKIPIVGVFDNEVKQQDNIKIYPNPTSQNITVSIDFKNHSNLELAIYDVVGKNVYEYQAKNQYFHGLQNFDFNLNNLKKGLYFVEVKTINGKTSTKLLIH
jgi:hypothetical protein